jgi:precorrin-4/cobalt-precorrin-4 C11-methyltransferase
LPGSSAAEEPTRLYLISSGPGDPELLTVAGDRALKRSGAVLAAGLYLESFSDLLHGKEIASPFTMNHATLTAWIAERLEHTSVAVLVPGDFATFSPFQPLAAHFGERSHVIPGVGSFSVASAMIKHTFDQPGVSHATVHTSPRAFGRDDKSLKMSDFGSPGRTLVLYMLNSEVSELAEELMECYPPETPIAIFERLGCPDAMVTRATLAKIDEEVGDRDPFGVRGKSNEPALALVVVGFALEANESPEWWDYRYEKVWKPREMK